MSQNKQCCQLSLIPYRALSVPVKVHNVLVVSLEVLNRAESLPAGGLLLHNMLIVNKHHSCSIGALVQNYSNIRSKRANI